MKKIYLFCCNFCEVLFDITEKQSKFVVTCGVAIFLFLQYLQNDVAVRLANMRRDRHGHVRTLDHVLPYGGPFEYISSPHYSLEISIYLTMAWVPSPCTFILRICIFVSHIRT